MPRKKKPELLDLEPGKVRIISNDEPMPNPLSVPRRPPCTLNSRKPFIRRLLDDDTSLAEIRELAENGASITSIEAVMKYPPGRLRTILEKGRKQLDTKGPYKRFYLMFRSWVGEARSQAETIMAKRTPEKWMDRNSSNRLLESEEDRNLAIEASNHNKPIGPNVPISSMVRALEILREQGISIDDALDKGQLHISSNRQEEDDDD